MRKEYTQKLIDKHLEKIGKLERNGLLQVKIKKESCYNWHTIGFYLTEQQNLEHPSNQQKSIKTFQRKANNSLNIKYYL